MAFNTYVCRPLAAPFVAAVAGTRLTPNQITLASFFVAAASAGLIVVAPGHGGLLAAVLLFEASYVLDCADGMLARLRGTASPVGHLLDFLMDELKAFLVLAAAAARLYLERGDPRFLELGLFGLVCLASGVAMTTFLRRPETTQAWSGGAADAVPRSLSRHAVAAAERVARLLIHYPSYIWLAALAGRIELYLYPYVAVNALYALRAFAGVAVKYGRS
jgi:phosphatidylglycerophosphate synthase